MFRFIWLLLPLFLFGCSEYDLKGDGDAGGSDSGLPSLDDDDGGGEAGDPGTFDGGIVGRVCDPGGGWVVGAYVYTTYDSTGDGVHDARAEDETDSEGAYELLGIAPDRDYIVYAIKGSFEATFEVTVGAGITEIPVEECMLEPPNIAVVSGEYDHIEDIISGMGLEYTLYNGQMGSTEYLNLLLNPDLMAEYDIIFFNCGMGTEWGSVEYYDAVRANLRSFVLNGGSIYNSDWAYYMVEATFADKIDFYGDDDYYAEAQVGTEGDVSADVLDPAMEIIIGSDLADINFDLGQWVVMDGVASDVEVLLAADVEIWTWAGYSTLVNRPIAARFEVGEGQVLYTSFHNEHAATTLDMTDILEEIILSL